MFLGDLPLEIRYNILEHCSPRDLAVLSRVHTSVRDVAEYALYSHIRYCAQPHDMVSSERGQAAPQRLKEESLLHTFANNSRKASMVKALYIELEKKWGYDDAVHFVLVKLAEALEKMPNLVDLRIIYSPMKESEGRITQAIRGGYFKLHTLYLDHSHDLEGIIADQPQLRLLGICFFLDILDMDLWTKVEQLYQSPSRRRTVPMVLLRDSSAHGGLIYMLPSFHRPGEALQACREIAASLNEWRKSFHGYELSLSLIGISEEDIGLLGEVIGAMAACSDYYTGGMNVVLHDRYIQKPWRFPEFVKHLALFKDLEELHFVLPDAEDDVLRLLSTDLQLWVNLGSGTWPTIQQIKIENQTGEENILLGHESEWVEDEQDDEDDETESEVEDYSDPYEAFEDYADSYGGYDSPSSDEFTSFLSYI